MRSVYWSSDYRHIRLRDIPKQVAFDIKCCWQRITKGFCDKDTWDIFQWFLEVMPEMLTYYKEHRHGSPSELGEDYVNEDGILVNDTCHENWDKVLDEMIFLFKESNEETCSRKNPMEKEYDRVNREFIKKYGLFGRKLLTEEEKNDPKGVRMYTAYDMPEYEGVVKEYLEEDRKIAQYRDDCKTRALELFSKYFWDLWD